MKKRDIILIAVFVLLAVAAIAVIKLTQKPGLYAVVSIDNREYGHYSLKKDTVIELNSDEGNCYLVIEEGKAYMREASCPDKICVKTGKISMVGEMIVCLPNKIIITIEDE